jgi:hypothetical protein
MNNPDHISESLETIFWVKIRYLNSLMQIRDPGWGKYGSGMEKNSAPGSAILDSTGLKVLMKDRPDYIMARGWSK